MRSTSYGLTLTLLFLITLGMGCTQRLENRQDISTSSCAVDATWPQKPERFKWGQMPGITFDGRDQVYIFTRSRPAVQVYKTDGTFVRAWDSGDPNGAHFIRIDPEGNVWAANFLEHVIRKHSPEGKLLLTIGQVGVAGSDREHFNKPTDMAVLPSGDIFVTDGYGNRRVVHFDANGKYVNEWGQEGNQPGQFALPHSIVADYKGRLYVADRENARIQVFDTTGKLLAVWKNIVTPWGLFMTKNQELWVCGSSCVKKEGTDEHIVLPPPDQVLMKLNLKGEVLLRIPLPKTVVPPGKPGELDWVHSVAVDSKGDLYLGDIQGMRAQKFSLKNPKLR
jgi:DNA-binding beta-propeller fold protein YncE